MNSKAAHPELGSRLGAYTFYTSAEYYQTLKQRIDATKAGDRIVLVTLWLRTEWEVVADVIDSLEAAARRGVDVTLLIDAFHFLVKHGAIPGPAFYFGPTLRYIPKSFVRRKQVIDRLNAAGAHCQIINSPSRPLQHPFKGRSHIKYSVINDEVFIGGCNLSEAHFLDVMVAWRDKQIADWLCEMAAGIVKTGTVRGALAAKDIEVPIDATTSLLLDSGKVGQSVILDRAHDIIDKAETEILITYQYFPEGSTAKRLHTAARRGVRLQTLYNHYSKHPFPLNILYRLVEWRERRKWPGAFPGDSLPSSQTYLHAKVISSEKSALLSSHNYSETGVLWGTAEIGLMSTDPAFIAKLNETILSQLEDPNS